MSWRGRDGGTSWSFLRGGGGPSSSACKGEQSGDGAHPRPGGAGFLLAGDAS